MLMLVFIGLVLASIYFGSQDKEVLKYVCAAVAGGMILYAFLS